MGLTIEAQETLGRFDLALISTDTSAVTKTAWFDSVDVIPGTVATCMVDTIGSTTSLSIDYNNDGIADKIVLPTSYTVTGVHELIEVGSRPGEFFLANAFPNPFDPSTTIRYRLPARSHVSLTVFNTLGQSVSTLIDGEQEAGYHEVRFDGNGLSSGVYFYRLQAGTFVETKRLLLLR